MARHLVALVSQDVPIIVIKRDPARSSNGKRPRTMMSVFAEDADIEPFTYSEPSVVPPTERLALWPAWTEVALGPALPCRLAIHCRPLEVTFK